MKKKFLEAVAEDIIAKYGTDLSNIAVVFPNKRASLFLNEYLAGLAEKPVWSPAYITIRDMFLQNSSLVVADQIKLICDLHKVFTTVTGIDESLDHFYGWGQLLLSDFDDIDKHMVDADKVFSNLRDIHELDDVSYLTSEQKELLGRFFSNFSDDHNSILKQRFLQLWSHFSDIYHEFNKRLEGQGLAYEGALYRKVAEDTTIGFPYDKYVFIGFNVLQEVEQQLFKRLKSEGKAKLYWDFDTYYKNDERQEAGQNVRQHLALFNNELDFADNEELYQQFSTHKDITYLNCQTNDVQARYVAQWLLENKRYADGRNTAIVLCDEKLLPSVIHNLPAEVEKVNITTGYPLSCSPFNTFVSTLIALQTHGIDKSHTRYRLHYVLKTLHHPYAKFISDKVQDILKDLSEHKQFYPNREYLCQDEGLELLFKDLKTDDEDTGGTKFIASLTSWLTDILQFMGSNAEDSEDALFEESLFKTYTLLNRIRELICAGDLDTDVLTLQRIIEQAINSTSIPFHGEPACGVQIMGVLETRNLDFNHILVLSCNEGNMPKGVSDASFIPYSIRKAYGLTTIDNKVAIYAYYFYRLLQRANDATFAYNSSTEDGKTGEMSRFMLQMLVESGHNIRKVALQTRQNIAPHSRQAVEKDNEVMNILNDMESLSPTAINRYIKCPLQFYYNKVAGIKEPDNTDEDSVDNRVFGNIFHLAAQMLYKRIMNAENIVTKSAIERLLKHTELIEMAVDEAFKEELFKMKDSRQKPEYNGLQIINREVIVSYLKQLLQIDARLGNFRILGLEKGVYTQLKINKGQLTIGGIIDRLDMVNVQSSLGDSQWHIRVVDYKTGHKPSQQVISIEEIFTGEKMQEKHTDYYLQTLLYAMIVKHSQTLNSNSLNVSPALLFIQHAGADDYNPILSIGKEGITDVEPYYDEFKERLTDVVNEIFNSEIPFTPTAITTRCTNCPYKRLCEK